jgi:hypothetical protein
VKGARYEVDLPVVDPLVEQDLFCYVPPGSNWPVMFFTENSSAVYLVLYIAECLQYYL